MATPQGIDSFSEGLSSFDVVNNVGETQPTAAVESAQNMNFTVSESLTKNPKVSTEESNEEKELSVMERLQSFYYNNQQLILIISGISIGYYMYSKNKRK